MEYFKSYFIENFILICISVILTINCLQKFKEFKRLAIYVMIILGITLTVSILNHVKLYSQEVLGNAVLCTICASATYVLLPTCICTFILLSGQKVQKLRHYLLFIPLGISVIIYLFPFFNATKHLVYYFGISEHDGLLHWIGGDTILRYTTHIVSAFYLAWLLYLSINSLRKKHIYHATSLFLSAAIVIIATVVETFFNEDGKIRILNPTIGVSVLFYYVYALSEKSKYDTLTNLFNRAMYYIDIPRMDKNIVSIIQIDMNGLKYVNDNFGHAEGDIALTSISSTLLKYASKNMYVYRLGGDEFTILVTDESENTIKDTINNIQLALSKTKYSVSIGYSYRKDKTTPIDELIKLADKDMYKNKNSFYETSLLERR